MRWVTASPIGQISTAATSYQSISALPCERDLLREDDVAVAIVAEDRSAAISANLQLPRLELFLSHALLVLLGDSDDIEQPVRSSLFGEELSAVGLEHGAIDAVAVPVFRPGELTELGSEL